MSAAVRRAASVMTAIARHVFAVGLVQGVAFRWCTRERAVALGVRGWVQNLADGRVEAWIEGEPQPVEDMLAWLRRGPPAARVERLDVEAEEAQGCREFAVRSTRPS